MTAPSEFPVYRRYVDATLVRVELRDRGLVYFRPYPGPALPVIVDSLDVLARMDVQMSHGVQCWSERTFQTLYERV